MKKLLLSVAGLSLSLMIFGQVSLNTAKSALVKSEEVSGTEILKTEKGGGDVFWSTSFDWADPGNPVGYSLPAGWEIVDNTDFGNPWMWRNDTIGGNFTTEPAPGHFLTPEDGFIVVPADEYNARDGVTTDNNIDTYITTESIDCSAVSSVVVKFNQYFRTCCAGSPTMVMKVTNDDGVHWAEYSCRFGLANNRVTDERFRRVEFNISDVAAGMGNVQIQFYWTGSSHYYWMIDDLRLVEAYENEVVLEDSWAEVNAGFDDRVGHVNYWPKTQMGMESPSTTLGGFIGDYEFSGAMLNNGMSDQWNLQLQMTVQKNGEEYWQEVSDPIELWSLDRDTLVANSAFLADDYGDYHITYAAISENDEQVPENNTSSIMFTVTDSLYHRADFTDESGSNTGGWVGGTNAGDMVGVYYDLFVPTEINSITSKIRGVTDEEFPEFQYVLFKEMEEGLVEWLSSEIYPADSTMERTWVTLDMEKDGETEFLEPGSYAAMVRFWGDDGTEEGSNGMSIGWDMDNRETGYTLMYQFVSDAWYSTGTMNQVGLVFNEKGGPTAASVTFNVDMNAHIANGEFNPGSDFVDVAGSFNDWNGSEPLTDEDGDGIYTITLDDFTIADKIEFKYRINANWDTSEFPDGGPNRTYTIRYWNELDNVYNNGETTGLGQVSLIEELLVYPNPSSGDFTVRISSKTPADFNIKLMNIQGNTVYQNDVKGVAMHTETIENNFAKGVYFLTINNGKDQIVRKVVLQ